jgi:hypothetical protein
MSVVQRPEKEIIWPSAASAEFSLGGEYIICKPNDLPQICFAQMRTFQSVSLAVEL